MNLKELSGSYRYSAALCRERAALLKESLATRGLSELERVRLLHRINLLVEMAADAGAIGNYLRHYYDGVD